MMSLKLTIKVVAFFLGHPVLRCQYQCFHFQGIFLVLAKSKEFWTPQGIFKEFQQFKEFQGNLREEKEIVQKFREFKEIWVKCKEN